MKYKPNNRLSHQFLDSSAMKKPHLTTSPPHHLLGQIKINVAWHNSLIVCTQPLSRRPTRAPRSYNSYQRPTQQQYGVQRPQQYGVQRPLLPPPRSHQAPVFGGFAGAPQPFAKRIHIVVNDGARQGPKRSVSFGAVGQKALTRAINDANQQRRVCINFIWSLLFSGPMFSTQN